MVEESKHSQQEGEFFEDEFEEDELEDDIDPELLDLAAPRRQGSILRPVLFLTVIWFGASIIGDWQTQLDYFFSSSDPVEVGSVTEFAVERARDPEWSPEIPHNRYVSVEGVPSRRAQSERYKFFKLVGDQVFVQIKRDDADLSELERQMQKEKGEIDRTYFEGAGRALHLSKTEGRYQGLRQYYWERYNTRFCGMDLPDPVPGELDEGDPECLDGYVIEIDVAPKNHWWYLALSTVIGIFILLNIWWLFRWIRGFFKRD